MPQPTNEQLVEWVDKIVRDGINMSTWEEQFIESMTDKIERYGANVFFTENQTAQIERIYSERVP